MFDLSAAADVAGGKFAILRNDAVLLELGLVQWAVNKAVAAGFTPVMAPDVAHAHIVAGCGFRPRDGGGESSQVRAHTLRVGGHSCTCVLMQLRGGGVCVPQIYGLAGTDLCLVGTGEISVAGMRANQILPHDVREIGGVGCVHALLTVLPHLFARLSPCVRLPSGIASVERRVVEDRPPRGCIASISSARWNCSCTQRRSRVRRCSMCVPLVVVTPVMVVAAPVLRASRCV